MEKAVFLVRIRYTVAMKALAYRPLVLIGPSGAGKSTVASRLADLPHVTIIPTVTTRPVRLLEDAYTHTFVDQQTFDIMKENGEFIGTAHMFGHDYGLPKLPPIRDQLVLLLRAPFVPLFRKEYPRAFVIQFEAPVPVLSKRLAQRGDDKRADQTMLRQEIAAGRKVADLVIDSSHPIDHYFAAIKQQLFAL